MRLHWAPWLKVLLVHITFRTNKIMCTQASYIHVHRVICASLVLEEYNFEELHLWQNKHKTYAIGWHWLHHTHTNMPANSVWTFLLNGCQVLAEKSLNSDISKARRVASSPDPVSVLADGLSLLIDIKMFLNASLHWKDTSLCTLLIMSGTR